MSLKSLAHISFFLLTILLASGCAPAEKSAAMVLDSASSTIRSGEEKIWIDPAATPIATPH